ncbi:MAG: hypothetical protein IT385_10890 [Deltaproteobacteria bacterium]|nr:hypothetical protein [Deltaproteobacteria bacterium]
MLVGVVVGIVVGRCRVSDSGTEAELERGLVAMAAAIGGERARFVEAEAHFAAASGGVIFDAYPLFLLELSRALREGRTHESDPRVAAVVERLAAGDTAGAVAGLPAIPEDFPGRHHLERAVIELARRTTTIPPGPARAGAGGRAEGAEGENPDHP